MPKTTQPPSRTRVGIVGGGQLAMMMAEASGNLPIDLSVLASSTSDSAVDLIPSHQIGSATNKDAVVAFGRQCDVVTFDHEVVNLDALKDLAASGVVIAPSPEALRFATDKAFQREEFARHGLPLPECLVLRELDLEALTEFSARHDVVVVKAARGGYDGRGVTVVHGDPTSLVSELLPHTPVVLEELLELSSEIAISVVTGRDGSRVVYPPVDTIQRNGMCESVSVPSRLHPDLVAAAQKLATDVADIVGAVGVLAIELFITSRGILINEVATRPHNSGHWSIEGAATSQFENHLRAVAGLELGDATPMSTLATMINVVGGEHEPDGLRPRRRGEARRRGRVRRASRRATERGERGARGAHGAGRALSPSRQRRRSGRGHRETAR